MKCTATLLGAFLLAVSILLTTSAMSPLLVFAPLEADNVFSGCGCAFSVPDPEGGIVFSSNYEGIARVRVDGTLHTLDAIQHDIDCRPASVGDTCLLKYAYDVLAVILDVEATWVCPPDGDEACELTRLRGQMTGQIDDAESTLDIASECGC